MSRDVLSCDELSSVVKWCGAMGWDLMSLWCDVAGCDVTLCGSKWLCGVNWKMIWWSVLHRSTPYYKVLLQYYSVLQSTTPVLILYYKVLLQYYSVLQSTAPVLLQYYSSTTLYCKVLLQCYAVLQSTTPVLFCTTKYYSSTTLYYKVELQYFVLQSTTPVLVCTTKYYSSTNSVLQSTTPVLLQYYSVLLQYYAVLQSTTPVLFCTTKYYCSTTLYYKVLLQYYSVLQSTTPVEVCTTKYYSSTILYYTVLLCTTKYKVLLQYYSILHRSTPVQLCTTKYYSSTILYYKVLLRVLLLVLQSTYLSPTSPHDVPATQSDSHDWSSSHMKTSVTMRRATGLILQPHQILHLPRKMTLMSDVRHIWNVIYNARSNRCHPSTSPSTVPATKSDSHHLSSWHMKRHLQCAEQQAPPSNLTKCCACHEKWLASLILVTYETSFTMRGATGITLQPHQILRLPRKIALQNLRKICRKQLKRQFQCAADSTMIRTWSDHEIAKLNPSVRRAYFSPLGKAFCIENYNISRSGYLPRFQQMLHLPRKMTLQDHQILRLPRKVTLMSDVLHIWNVIYNARSNRTHPPTSPNTAPATQNDSHEWCPSHMKRHLQCAEQQVSPSNLTKCCACHEKWHAWLILVTYETSFTMRGATGITLQPHQILRLPRKIALQNLRKICRKQLKRQFQCAAWSEHDPTMKLQNWTRPFAPSATHFVLKITTFRAPAIYPDFSKCFTCHETWHCKITKYCACHEKWLAPARSPRLLLALRRRILYWKLQHFTLRLSTQISPNTVPATKSDTPTSPNAAPATKSDTPRSPNTAPATKSSTPRSPNAAPAMKSDTELLLDCTLTCYLTWIVALLSCYFTELSEQLLHCCYLTELLLDWAVTSLLLLYWAVTLLSCYFTELLLSWAVTLLSRYFTELLLDWAVTLLSCYLTEQLLHCCYLTELLLYWAVTLLSCYFPELLLYWAVTLLSCYFTELFLYWAVTLVSCYFTELLLDWAVTWLSRYFTELLLYWAVTLLSCYFTELLLYWAVTLLSCYFTELLLYWADTWLSCYLTELLLYWTVTLLSCYFTELLLDWTVTLLSCFFTELLLYWAVTLLSCYFTELFLYWAVTLLSCYLTELLLDWTVTWLSCYFTELLLYWAVTLVSCYFTELLLYWAVALLSCYCIF